jgi:hypothetical protein
VFLRGLFVSVLMLAFPEGAHAGISSFIDGCIANIGDLAHLGMHLEASGMREIDPPHGPRLLIGTGSPQRLRLWQTTPVPAGMIDAFTGYAVDDIGFPAEICFHISRPGESAEAALRELKYRYPPISGTRKVTSYFYGGNEFWETRINDVRVIMGVVWGMKSRPDIGTGELYVAKPLQIRTGKATTPISVTAASRNARLRTAGN